MPCFYATRSRYGTLREAMSCAVLSFLILPVLALVFLFVYFSFVNPRALIEFVRWLEKLF